jgi:hypothetical protein
LKEEFRKLLDIDIISQDEIFISCFNHEFWNVFKN